MDSGEMRFHIKHVWQVCRQLCSWPAFVAHALDTSLGLQLWVLALVQGSCSWRKWHIGQNMPMSSHRASSPSSWPAKNSISTIASMTAWHGTAISRWPGLPFVQRCSWPAHSGKQQLPAVRPLPGRASRNIMSLLCLQTCAHLCADC